MSTHALRGHSVRVAVVGPGAVGTVIAYALNKSGVKPYLIYRTAAQAREAHARGVNVVVGGVLKSVKAVPTSYSSLTRSSVDLAFLTVKAYDAEAAAKSLKPVLRDGAAVVICQNGLGATDAVRRVLGAGFRFVRAVLNLGAFRRGDGVTELAGVGESYVGSVAGAEGRDAAEYVASLLNPINVRLVDDILRYVWLKLAVNAGINPVTALLRVTNGVLLEDRPALTAAAEAAAEAAALARKRGVILPRDPVAELVKVAEATSGNRSSMLQDVLSGRRTEVDFINGAVCVEGLKEGVEAKVNCLLWALVKSLELRHT